MAQPRSFKKSSTQLQNILVELNFSWCWLWWPQDNPCLWLGFTAEASKASTFSTFHSQRPSWGFCTSKRPAKSFFKVPAKMTKILRRSFCRGEEWEWRRMNTCGGTEGKLGRLLSPSQGHFALVWLVDMTRPWGTMCHQQRSRETETLPQYEGLDRCF